MSKDGKTYTFYLRKDAKWTNGDPVTADDYVY
ncbi:ABC transporter substrate-binding protein, partial [Francisella orientalis]